MTNTINRLWAAYLEGRQVCVSSMWIDGEQWSETVKQPGFMSDQPLSMVAFRDGMYLGYVVGGEVRLAKTSDGKTFIGRFTSIASVDGSVAVAKTEATPALAVFNDKLVIAYQDESNQICICTYDDDEWLPDAPIKLSEAKRPDGLVSISAPSLAVFRGKLFVGCAGADGEVLVSQSSDCREFKAVNTKLRQGKEYRLWVKSPPAPGLAVFKDKLYVAHRSDSQGSVGRDVTFFLSALPPETSDPVPFDGPSEPVPFESNSDVFAVTCYDGALVVAYSPIYWSELTRVFCVAKSDDGLYFDIKSHRGKVIGTYDGNVALAGDHGVAIDSVAVPPGCDIEICGRERNEIAKYEQKTPMRGLGFPSGHAYVLRVGRLGFALLEFRSVGGENSVRLNGTKLVIPGGDQFSIVVTADGAVTLAGMSGQITGQLRGFAPHFASWPPQAAVTDDHGPSASDGAQGLVPGEGDVDGGVAATGAMAETGDGGTGAS